MANEITKYSAAMAVETLQKSDFTKSLPGHIKPEKFLRTIQTALAMTPKLRDAVKTKGGFESLMNACAKAAADGLILDGREAALVPMRVKVGDDYEERLTYMPMYQGLLKKARNSGEIASITAHVVYDNDQFSYTKGDDESITHIPAGLDEPTGKGIAVYAIAKLKSGQVVREVMPASAVKRIANQSRNKDQYDQDKGLNWGEWWRKTALRRICKYLPSSADLDEMFDQSDRQEFDFNQDTQPESLPPRKRRGGAAKVIDQTPVEDQSQDETYDDHDPDTGEVIEAKRVEGQRASEPF